MKNDSDMKISLNTVIFKKLVFTVFAYIAFYSLVYFYLDARLSATMLLLGCIVFTPLILVMEKRFPNAARMAFCLSCVFYIFATPFGIHHPTDVEFYYLAALMVPIILFNPQQRGWIVMCILMCPAAWSYQTWGPMPEFSSFWMATSFPHKIFQKINFFGPSLIIVIFLKYLVDRFQKHNLKATRTLSELNQFFNLALDILCIADEEGNFLKVNPAFQNLLGYSAGELESRSFVDLLHPDDIPESSKVFKAIKMGTPVRNFQNRYKASDGSYKLLSWSTAFDPELKMVYAAGRDITELAAAEERAQIEKTKALLNDKLALLGEMYSGIAHEINNPLMVISGNAQMIEKEISDPVKIKDYGRAIVKATDRIVKIINGLRKFSHTSETVSFKPCDLTQILRETLLLTEWKAKKHGIKLILDFEESLPPVNCNEIEIEQVMINLINNGIDAVKDLPEKWVKVALREEKELLMLRISDSGEGIPDSISTKLFQPFFTTKPVGEGTGIGLSIVKGIIDEHGATIELVKNSPNTCFEVLFPKAKQAK